MTAGKSGSIWASLGLKTDEFQKGVNKSKGSMKGLEGQAMSFGKSLLAAFTFTAAVESMVSFGKEAFDLAGKFKGVENSFKKLNDPNLLGNLQKATKGTVSDLELMQNAVKAKNLGLPVQQLATYFEFARRRAKETGESVDYLVQSIVTGIGRKSPLILDNLGISASALNDEIKKTGDFGLAAGNIISREMANMGEDIDTASEKTARLSAIWENFKVLLGTSIANDLDPYLGALDNLINGNENLIKIMGDLSDSYGFTNLKLKDTNQVINETVNQFDKLSLSQLKSEKGVKSFVSAMLKLGLTTDEIKGKFEGLAKTKLIQSTSLKPVVRTISLIDEEIKAQQEMLGFASDRSGAMAIQERIAKLEREKERILGNTKALKEQIKLNKAKEGLDFSVSNVSTKGLQLKESETPTFVIQQGIEALPSLFDNAMASLEMRVKRTEDAMKASASAINTAFANIAAEGLATLGAALGTAFAGGDVMQIGMQFANMIADAIGGLGRNLIEIGIVMTGVMETLKTGGFANPALLIGGGIALVALSSAMKGMASNSVGFADGGLVTGSVFANIGEGIGTNSANPEVIAPLDKLKNFINPNQNDGMSGNVSFRIEGNTLVGILDRQRKTTKYGR